MDALAATITKPAVGSNGHYADDLRALCGQHLGTVLESRRENITVPAHPRDELERDLRGGMYGCNETSPVNPTGPVISLWLPG